MAESPQEDQPRALSYRDLTLLRRAAEDAIDAANPRYAPFIDAGANPLNMLILIEMAMRGLKQTVSIEAQLPSR